jgi:glucose-6-phosphate 1-dehydrogenase
MQPLIFTIFGATGDLTFRKLIPALFTLFIKDLLPSEFTVIGFARREWMDVDFKMHLDKNVDKKNYDPDNWNKFLDHVNYLSSDFSDIKGYEKLSQLLQNADAIKVFYMATAPEYFKIIAENLEKSPLKEICKHDDNSRIVVEKPYGMDLENTCEIDKILRASFLEEHIYRIDHYIGKESVQNILVFRFANSIFEKIWNKENIDHIQIKVDESVGVEERGEYYDKTGAIKDMVQNHILQLLSLIAMNAPDSINAKDIQKRRLEILQNVTLWDPVVGNDRNNSLPDFFLQDANIILGQYENYKNEKNINPDSKTATFVAMKLKINLPNWEDIPIYIRTGKKMKKKISEISIKFKDRDKNIYDKMTGNQNDILTFRIQPEEGISMMVMTKEPGSKKPVPVSLDFCYRPTFHQPILDSYVGLIQNVIEGDQSLFTSIEEIEAQWKFVSGIQKILEMANIYLYKEGSDGPENALRLLKNDKREWIENENYVCAIR